MGALPVRPRCSTRPAASFTSCLPSHSQFRSGTTDVCRSPVASIWSTTNQRPSCHGTQYSPHPPHYKRWLRSRTHFLRGQIFWRTHLPSNVGARNISNGVRHYRLMTPRSVSNATGLRPDSSGILYGSKIVKGQYRHEEGPPGETRLTWYKSF